VTKDSDLSTPTVWLGISFKLLIQLYPINISVCTGGYVIVSSKFSGFCYLVNTSNLFH
jgi:hypothetical protein